MEVTDLRIYPIKALDAVCVGEARVLASGALEFDRRWAMQDARGRFVNGKFHAGVHGVRSVYDLSACEVTLNQRTFSLTRQGAEIAQWFSELLGQAVTWNENAEAGFPDDTDSPGPTFVSTPSLERVASWFELPLDQARPRFRTNVEFSAPEPFWEDRLYGSEFRAGDVTAFAVNPCQRCIVPQRDAQTGERIANFQKRFAELREAQMPAFAKTGQFNHYYRFAVNTRIAPSEAGKFIRVGAPIDF
ncbi:MAG: MOSC N-terminal beta barrel domain-containing protein [Acidobacteriota bacterium]